MQMPGGARYEGPRHDWLEGMDVMNTRRGTLYTGVFLIAAGSVTLGVAVGVLDANAVANTVDALWPLALVALGTGLVLRRSRAALGAGVVAALVPGLALGASIVAAPDLPARWMDDARTLRPSSIWETAAFETTPCKAGLAIDAGIGSVTIYPEGGCK
jgi:hypothetical protein